MIHNLIAINYVQRYKAKGTDKRNADINVCSGLALFNILVRVNIDMII